MMHGFLRCHRSRLDHNAEAEVGKRLEISADCSELVIQLVETERIVCIVPLTTEPYEFRSCGFLERYGQAAGGQGASPLLTVACHVPAANQALIILRFPDFPGTVLPYSYVQLSIFAPFALERSLATFLLKVP